MSKKRFITVLVSSCAIAGAITYIILSVAAISARARKNARYVEPDYIRYAAQGYSFDSISKKTNILLTVTDGNSPLRIHLFTLDEDKKTLDILDIPPLTYVVADGFSGTLRKAYETSVYKEIVSDSLALPVHYQLSMTDDALSTAVMLLDTTSARLSRQISLSGKTLKKGGVSFDKDLSRDVIAIENAYSDEDSVYIYHALLSSVILRLGDLGALESVSKLTGLILNSVKTDMSVSDIIDIASVSSTVSIDKTKIYLLPGEICLHNGETVYSAHLNEVCELLNKSFRTKGGDVEAKNLGIGEITDTGRRFDLPRRINDYKD